MLEFYQAYADYRDLMDWVEKAIRGLADTLHGTQQDHLPGARVRSRPEPSGA